MNHTDTLKNECICHVSLIIKLAPSGFFRQLWLVQIIEVVNVIFLTQQCDCTASFETKREGGKNQQALRGGKTRISGQQHPRSLVGRQTAMLKFRSHTRLQTTLLTREGKDERHRGRKKGGGGVEPAWQHTEEEE